IDYVIAKHFGIGLTLTIHDYSVDMKVEESYSNSYTLNYKWRQNVTYVYGGINLHYHF
ncbi:MAG: hypothetical protein JWO58_2858, partial [Chitinophagaceae bacterium]|nr:hypothetical protein [Chitinophagaceae bacterium]